MDDVNILTYSQSTEENCRNLERIHSACEEWVSCHGSTFSLKKYELIHFTHTPKRFNLKASIQVTGTELIPKDQIKVLGIQLNSVLQWNPQLKAVEAHAVHQLNTLKLITGST